MSAGAFPYFISILVSEFPYFILIDNNHINSNSGSLGVTDGCAETADSAWGALSHRSNSDGIMTIREREKKENVKRKTQNMEQEDIITASTHHKRVPSDIFGIPGLKKEEKKKKKLII